MKIAVASGKGGTGKTMVATSLAACLSGAHTIQFLDCDVEAPNAHLFLKPNIKEHISAIIRIPIIDENTCTHCGRCVEVCEFNALAKLADNILVFPQLCHGCGTCMLNCPVGAISEEAREIGQIHIGSTKSDSHYLMGELTVSEPMPTPIIRQLKTQLIENKEVTILDSPPGASCSVVATIHDADFVLLVTEPTPFGLHDLKQMLGVIKATGSPAGVIINRDGIGDQSVEDYLADTPYPILMRIPYQEKIAVGLAEGAILSEILPEYQLEFVNLFDQIVDYLPKKGGKNA